MAKSQKTFCFLVFKPNSSDFISRTFAKKADPAG